MRLKLLTILVLAGCCLAQQKQAPNNPYAGDAHAIELGRVQFRMSCASCHGLHATGGRSGPDLTRGTFAAGDTDADLYRVVSSGVPGSEMPGFDGRLEDEQRWRLVAYVRSLTPHDSAPIAGDPAAGEKLFWEKGTCGQCHRVGSRGSGLGPNLTRAGRQRSVAYLRESVTSPNTEITPGYATITVVTRDGKKITGLDKGLDNFSARLMDLSGHYYSFQKDDVASIQREDRSLMPATYSNMFSAKELDDLVAYLVSLGGGQP
ncbi:MAG TPA: c-type cytochrome [Bryobacteraceae bacterium]|nr:c-type cytochrome [Bryobacteraceae bacterium]